MNMLKVIQFKNQCDLGHCFAPRTKCHYKTNSQIEWKQKNSKFISVQKFIKDCLFTNFLL